MRICFFVGDMSRSGGTERMTQLLSAGLAKENEVFVLSVRDGNKKCFFELDKGIYYQALTNDKYIKIVSLIKIIFLLISYLKKNRIDTLIDVDTALAVYSLPACYFCPKVKKVSWEHFSSLSDSGNKRMNTLRKLALKHSDAFVTLTREDVCEFTKRYDVQCYLTDITNIAPFKLYSGKYNRGSKTIITIGNLLPIKGQDMALDAAQIVLKKHGDWKWLFYGAGPNKELLLNKVKALGLDEKVNFMAPVTDIADVYSSASICVMPSKSEGFGLVLAEAQSFKLPTVAFDVPYGPRQIIENEKNGYLIEPFDTDEMADRICRLIEDDELRASFSEHAQDNLYRFSKESVVKKWQELLKKITE